MSFLRNYLTYATGNEAPQMFHVWGAYVCLSAAISRTVWLPFEDTAIYPNIYVMYVGSAGNGKSWAMKKARRLLAELKDPEIPVSASIETPQGMWRFMTGQPEDKMKGQKEIPPGSQRLVKWPDGQTRPIHPMTIFANEFVNFISTDDKGWINALNDIYDEDLYHYRTKGQGEDQILGPYIVLIGALTTEVSNDLQKAQIISTGLARRTIFQYGERQWFNPHPKPEFNAEQQAARARAKEQLERLRQLTGPFIWTPEVDAWWNDWYAGQLAEVPKKPPQTQGWFASKSVQVMKIAMLTALSERESLTLSPVDFEVALAYLNELEKDLFRIFGGSGRNELAAVAVKLVEFLAGHPGPVPLRRVRSAFFHICRPPNEFEVVVEHLKSSDQIIEITLQALAGTVPTSEVCLTTPEVLKRFVAEHPQLRVATQNGSLPGSESATGPSA